MQVGEGLQQMHQRQQVRLPLPLQGRAAPVTLEQDCAPRIGHQQGRLGANPLLPEHRGQPGCSSPAPCSYSRAAKADSSGGKSLTARTCPRPVTARYTTLCEP